MADLKRLREPYAVYVSSRTVTADGLVNFNVNGETTPYLPLHGVDWERVVVDQDVTAASGTSPTLDTKFKTVNDKSSTAPTTSTMNATLPAGTAVALTQATGATREIKGIEKGGVPGLGNLGSYFCLFDDVGGTNPSFTVKTTVYIGL